MSDGIELQKNCPTCDGTGQVRPDLQGFGGMAVQPVSYGGASDCHNSLCVKGQVPTPEGVKILKLFEHFKSHLGKPNPFGRAIDSMS